MEKFSESQTWYVVFNKTRGAHRWWKIFLHKDFGHVYAIRESNGGSLLYNYLQHATAISNYDEPVESIIAREIDGGVTAVLALTVHYSSHYLPTPIEILTCVNATKRLLGIRKRIYTPKGLYHEMIKAGAHILKPYCIDK